MDRFWASLRHFAFRRLANCGHRLSVDWFIASDDTKGYIEGIMLGWTLDILGFLLGVKLGAPVNVGLVLGLLEGALEVDVLL